MAASAYTRRAFLKTMSVGAATLALPGCQPSSEQAAPLPEQAQPLPQIGLQLWTVREAIEQDMAGTLRKLADMGYAGVETAFFPENVTVAQAGRALQEAGLTVLGLTAKFLSAISKKPCSPWPRPMRATA